MLVQTVTTVHSAGGGGWGVAKTPSMESLILLALRSGPSLINQQKYLSKKQT